jgi:hypothetical protein
MTYVNGARLDFFADETHDDEKRTDADDEAGHLADGFHHPFRIVRPRYERRHVEEEADRENDEKDSAVDHSPILASHNAPRS